MNVTRGFIFSEYADAYAIPTNGAVDGRRRAVMGAGLAREARERYAGIDVMLGRALRAYGNHVHDLGDWPSFSPASCKRSPNLVSFPTKDRWQWPSSLPLIRQSAIELLELTNRRDWRKVILPKVGCGRGGLAWADVEAALDHIWAGDERFHIVDKAL